MTASMANSQSSSRSTSVILLRDDEDETVDDGDEGNQAPRLNEARRGDGTAMPDVTASGVASMAHSMLETALAATAEAATGVSSASALSHGCSKICSRDGRSAGRYSSKC